MAKKILITGGAGFVGSHLADELLEHGYEVRVLDCLAEQVHGTRSRRPALPPEVEFREGHMCDAEAVSDALAGADAVFHLAAAVGVGQSMYEIDHYTNANARGTAVLLEALARKPVERLIVASSMSIYGEGLYQAQDGTVREGQERTLAQLRNRDWEVRDEDGGIMRPLPTPESKGPALPSVYALTKYYQEKICLTVGRAYDIPTVALRFFNIYGPRQALSNPYTGVLAIFASRLLNGKPPLINEDGEQRRDFVNVRDVARACRLGLESPRAAGHVFNIGSGKSYSIREIAELLAKALDCEKIPPDITGRFRMGDIRNCFADITHAREVLGYVPEVALEEGLKSLAEWVSFQDAEDHVSRAAEELLTRGLAA